MLSNWFLFLILELETEPRASYELSTHPTTEEILHSDEHTGDNLEDVNPQHPEIYA